MEIPSIADITVEVEGLKFILRPREYTDLMFWRSKVGELEIEDADTQALGYMLSDTLLRIKAWEGIEMDGKPAPCNQKTKNALFTQRPILLNQIAMRVAEIEGAVEKNLETSQAG